MDLTATYNPRPASQASDAKRWLVHEPGRTADCDVCYSPFHSLNTESEYTAERPFAYMSNGETDTVEALTGDCRR